MSKVTLSEVATAWKAYKRQYVKKSSYSIYALLCNKYILPSLGSATRLDEQSIQSFAADLLSRGFSIKTVRDTMLVLKMIIRFGEKMNAWPHLEYAVHYPTDSEVPREVTTLSDQHLRALLQHLKGHFSFRNLGILICLHSGLRIGEVCGLQWQDIDVQAGVIRVNKTVQRIVIRDEGLYESFVEIGRPKTISSIREIPLPHDLLALIRPFKKVMPPGNYLLSGTCEPMEPRTLRNYFHNMLRDLGIPKVRFHALRHSFATRCIASRCDYKTVSAILGHSSISTTLDLYVHPDISDKKRCINRLAKEMK